MAKAVCYDQPILLLVICWSRGESSRPLQQQGLVFGYSMHISQTSHMSSWTALFNPNSFCLWVQHAHQSNQSYVLMNSIVQPKLFLSLGTACTSVKPVICPREQHCSTQTLSHPQKLECSCLSSMLMEALHACIMQIHMFYMNDDPEDKLNSLCRDNLYCIVL